MNCRKCKTEMAQITIDNIQASFYGLNMTIDKLPLLECKNCNIKRYCVTDFGTLMMDSLYQDSKMLLARQKGFLKKQTLCGKCEKDISNIDESSEEISCQICLKDTSPFDIKISGNLKKCPSCNTLQFINKYDLNGVVADLLIMCFESQKIER